MAAVQNSVLSKVLLAIQTHAQYLQPPNTQSRCLKHVCKCDTHPHAPLSPSLPTNPYATQTYAQALRPAQLPCTHAGPAQAEDAAAAAHAAVAGGGMDGYAAHQKRQHLHYHVGQPNMLSSPHAPRRCVQCTHACMHPHTDRCTRTHTHEQLDFPLTGHVSVCKALPFAATGLPCLSAQACPPLPLVCYVCLQRLAFHRWPWRALRRGRGDGRIV